MCFIKEEHTELCLESQSGWNTMDNWVELSVLIAAWGKNLSQISPVMEKFQLF